MSEMFEFELPDLVDELIASPPAPLPDSDHVSRWALEKERKVFFEADVGEWLLRFQRLVLRWNMEDRGLLPAERKPIWLYIMSYGGDIDYMWSVIDTIRTSVTPVYTVNMGIAASAAALIFLSGAKRMMMPTAKMIIHEGSAQLAGDAVKVMDQSESYRKQLKQMKEFVLAHSEIPRQQLMKKRNNDWELDATYCIENGACDTIVQTLDDVI